LLSVFELEEKILPVVLRVASTPCSVLTSLQPLQAEFVLGSVEELVVFETKWQRKIRLV